MEPLEFLEFLSATTGGTTPEERFIFCGFKGDPYDDIQGKWRPTPWRSGDQLPISPEHTNGYLAISTFHRNERGEFRRRQDLFNSCRVVMIDDIGTKVPASVLKGIEPTFKLETSPDNYQWMFVLETPEPDKGRVSALLDGFVRKRLADGKDPGMKGVNRVFRLPGFINGKRKYGGWRCRLEDGVGPLWSMDGLASALRLSLKPAFKEQKVLKVKDPERDIKMDYFRGLLRWLRDAGAIKEYHTERGNYDGWYDVICPFIDDHSDRVDTGSSIHWPSPENDYHGAFRCHHGHCADKTWNEFTAWAHELITEELLMAGEKQCN